MTRDEIIKIAHDFVSLGGGTVELSGGEPFLHPDMYDIIRSLKGLQLSVSIFTCGRIANHDDFEVVTDDWVERLRKQEVDKIVFSMHGSNAQTHDAIANAEGSFGYATRFIKKLTDNGLHVGVHFVPMSTNFEELKDLVDLASKLGVREIGILRFVPQGRGELNKESLVLKKEEVAQLVELVTEAEKRKDIKVRVGSHLDFTFLLDGNPPKKCNAGIQKCLIEANGNVIPCAVFKGMKDDEENDYIAGNIRRMSLADIWRTSSVFDKFRAFSPKSLKGECAQCPYLFVCRGRCPAQRIYDHHDFYQGPDNYCPRIFFEKRSQNKRSC